MTDIARTAAVQTQVLALELGLTESAKKEIIQKHLVAMLAMERRDKWEPIETLPFNERVLVWNREVGLHTYVALDEFWRDDWEFTDFEPTHWQPLPSPPEGRSDDR